MIRENTRTALCCRCFTLPLSPEQLWENYHHYVILGFGDHLCDPGYPPRDDFDRGPIEDVEFYIEHFRYIGYRPPSFARYEHKDPEINPLIHFYTCDLLNPRTGLCSIHGNRPRICQIYMYCEHPTSCDSFWCSCHPSGDLRREFQNLITNPGGFIKAANRLIEKFTEEEEPT